MPATQLQDVHRIDARILALLNALTDSAALTALRRLFVEELDFEARDGNIRLSGQDLPDTAIRIAEKQGVQVVAVRLRTRGRVLVQNIREALKDIGKSLDGDILLVAGNAEGGEWQLVYPSTRDGREVLRRISLHRGQSHRTVVEQLGKVYGRARRGDLRQALDEAYDVEAVTREFFKQYKIAFDRAVGLVAGLEEEQRRLFCQVLFNRLMFIYFLQRMGRLTFNGRTDYLEALWRDATAKGENFYEERLRLLFFVGLSHPRSAKYDQARRLVADKIGDVPFLNGGLFSETELDQTSGIQVPNEAIGALLQDVFQRFNFTITESTPYDIQVAVDPEMLGKVFEELVTGRHETGSYYTPRPIVSFMCREALKGYLRTEVKDLPAEVVARYVDEDRVEGISVEQAGRILKALERITVVDPACGSGAYLLGMMQELLEAHNALYNPQLVVDAKSQFELKLHIIQHNVYGVDIDEFAVNIAMLRLWLSLIVEFDGPGDPPALPNLDFKIVRGDSISGPDPGIHPADLIEDSVRRMALELADLKNAYAVASGEEKNELHRQVEAQQRELERMMALPGSPQGAINWRVAFAEVFPKGGFDVVLANPPYVRQELIKDQKPRLKAVYGVLYSGTADLYVYFYYRALQLLRDGGMLVFISSNKWFKANYGAKLRELMATRSAIWSITDFGDLPVFEEATAYPMIFIAQRSGAPRPTSYTDVPSLAPPYPDVRALIRQAGFALSNGAIAGVEWRLARADTIARLNRMRLGTTPLGEYVGGRIYYGIKTGFNQAFVIDGATKDALIAADASSAEIIKPFIVGKDIRRWAVDYKDRWLIFTRRGIDMDRYPAILDHLGQWREELTPKQVGAPRDAPGRKPGPYRWYEIQDNVAYYGAFEKPKIVYPDIAKEARFTLDTTDAYPDCTMFLAAVDDSYLLGVLNSTAVQEFGSPALSMIGVRAVSAALRSSWVTTRAGRAAGADRSSPGRTSSA